MAFAGRTLPLCVLALILLGAAAPRPALHTFIAQMRAASGEPYRYHIAGQSVERSDGSDIVTRSEASGLQFLSHVCAGALCTGSYFDGTRIYGVTVNDTPLATTQATAKFIRGLRFVSSGLFLSRDFEGTAGALTDLGTMQRDGKAFHAIGVNAPDATPLIVLVDPKTHLVDSIRDWKSDVVVRDEDYRAVGPLMLPFSIDQGGVRVQRYTERTIVSEPFVAPRGIPAQSGPPATLKMVGSSPVVDCAFAGLKVRCLIDTGNSGLAMSRELAERLKLEPVGEFEVHGLGRYATEVVRGGPLTVGNKTFGTAHYVVLHDIRQFGYDLVLGADMLATTIVELDYPNHEMTIGSGGAPPAQTLPMTFINFVPVVPVALGRTLAVLAVDTGDESTINLSYDYYRQHTDLFATTEARSVRGVGGSSEELLGEIPHVQIGEFRVESQTIGTTKTLQATGEGHLGAGFLSHFRVVLDYANGKLGLTARGNDPAFRP